MEMLFHPLYKEPYRNQFHYSPPYGWMNDINGMWYSDGIYHLTYQHSADGLRCISENICVGHAYSKDLIHWYSAPVAVMCGRQCKSGVWSGTAYVDTENHSGFGENAVFLANTDKENGQYITVSTDGGWNFDGLVENPVVVLPDSQKGTPPCHQRDPKIFWLDSEQCFIMIVFFHRREVPSDENSPLIGSMDFYSSKDMKQWTFFQRLDKEAIIVDLERQGQDASFVKNSENILFECPNMIPMEHNGQSHWVLYGGDSRYVIGRFDGLHFTVTQAPLEPLSYGPSFYAGQTFHNADRHIAMFWLENWHGSTVDTFPFRNSATVAAELTLRETEHGLRVYRYPVEELASIRKEPIVIAPLSDDVEPPVCSAPYFDAVFTVDWDRSSSSSFTLQVADKRYTVSRYGFTAQHSQRPGHTVVELTEGVKAVRVLADRDSVEIFFNDGRKSYTEEYGFEADTLAFALLPDEGKSLEVSGKFFPLQSIWD